MPQQTITVNGHVYQLLPIEETTNPDYDVTLPATHPGALMGTLTWVGNGESNFSYEVSDIYGETLGTYPNLTEALVQLDALIFRG
jgi:hypothetical protein